MSDTLIAIVPAAGVGARASQPGAQALPKQYRLLDGQPMLRRAVQALLADERIAQVRVAVSAGDGWVEEALRGLPRTIWRPCGGATRADTVANALADSGAGEHDWVLVHDAARPGLTPAALARLIDACLADPVGGLLALPVADTVKAGSAAPDAPRVVRTVDRQGLWLAQTPQMFRTGLLGQCLAAAARGGLAVTDEASAIEAAGHAPCLVIGEARNFKVTWPDDFELMERWL
ncbi:2-C-methyl-D-erythritol 4-phosphate cytidylyltransferase [Bordetella ansorpii]|uniref:2-C-methyl-D-erythritol 4-phosphate cytidylyltransferase n=1 Tax=Bordetella ansorpii TaxID=288768 RepID=A0A157PP30_9BORD|nr:2-C-methyl-D-erythritol 4-phosphate cytidylyltransferase [Bordetella ansorpii]SAI35271.1 2-C-methyl-D-erythritol 4-phosphate cytidylyltransferase [Bordetella ansorpii]